MLTVAHTCKRNMHWEVLSAAWCHLGGGRRAKVQLMHLADLLHLQPSQYLAALPMRPPMRQAHSLQFGCPAWRRKMVALVASGNCRKTAPWHSKEEVTTRSVICNLTLGPGRQRGCSRPSHHMPCGQPRLDAHRMTALGMLGWCRLLSLDRWVRNAV